MDPGPEAGGWSGPLVSLRALGTGGDSRQRITLSTRNNQSHGQLWVSSTPAGYTEEPGGHSSCQASLVVSVHQD